MMSDTPSSEQIESDVKELSLAEQIQQGFEYRAIELVITGYKKMYDKGRYDPNWKENKFTAILKSYIDEYCQEFTRKTRQCWHVEREHYLDNLEIIEGDEDPDKAARIDIVIVTWNARFDQLTFPFECKLLDEKSSTLIRLYIQKGLIDRYLTDKDYAGGKIWGGMIGYVVGGSQQTIAEKINAQITKRLDTSSSHLVIGTPMHNFESIYFSTHSIAALSRFLKITHLLLPFSA